MNLRQLFEDLKLAVEGRDWEAVSRLLGAGFVSFADLYKLLLGGTRTAAVSEDLTAEVDGLTRAVEKERLQNPLTTAAADQIDWQKLLDTVLTLVELYKRFRGG